MTNNWDSIVSELQAQIKLMHEAREKGLQHCRQIVHLASKTIRNVHRRQIAEARSLLQQTRMVADQARAFLKPHPELYFAGYLHDSEKEYVEAAAVFAIVVGEPLPTPGDLGAQPMSYLNGMGEAASELRRYVLDEMRAGNIAESERILGQMEVIYDDLITFDFPDTLTGGLRRTCDALRAVIERTRSDLTMTHSQQELIRELRASRRVQE